MQSGARMGMHATDQPRQSAKDYLDAIEHAERYFHEYQLVADRIDREYAQLSRLNSAVSRVDCDFRIFWANCQILFETIYARPPAPAVKQRFATQRELPRESAEILERAITSTFEMSDVDAIMKHVRDGMVRTARGAAWVIYDAKQGADGNFDEAVKYLRLHRRDIVHEPARNWDEVGWVARAMYLSRQQMERRFPEHFAAVSGKREDHQGNEQKTTVYEVWDKVNDVVVWVVRAYDEFLDQKEPWLKLKDFFPCPKPSYATLQPDTLIPVPEFLLIEDQLQEVKKLTTRIAALTESLKMRGFVPGGGSDLSEAIQRALESTTDRALVVPVSEYAALGGANLSQSLVWLPLDVIASTIQALIVERRQVIEDIYQLTGIADIMRGDSDPNETLGAQRIKTQWGSVRIRGRQQELVRFAVDLTRITGEIIAEEFQPETLRVMSQSELPTRADIETQVQQAYAQMARMAADVQAQIATPEAQQTLAKARDGDKEALALVQQFQQQAAQAEQQMQAQIQKLQEAVTFDDAADFLRAERVRPFVLEIETDSTIQPDENEEKQRRGEFIQHMMGLLQVAVPAVRQYPMLGPLIGRALQFAAAPYRAGREMQGTIEDLTQKLQEMSADMPIAPEPGDPNEERTNGPEAQAKAAQIQQQMAIEQRQEERAQAEFEMRVEIEAKKAKAEIEEIEARTEKLKADAKRAQRDDDTRVIEKVN